MNIEQVVKNYKAYQTSQVELKETWWNNFCVSFENDDTLWGDAKNELAQRTKEHIYKGGDRLCVTIVNYPKEKNDKFIPLPSPRDDELWNAGLSTYKISRGFFAGSHLGFNGNEIILAHNLESQSSCIIL